MRMHYVRERGTETKQIACLCVCDELGSMCIGKQNTQDLQTQGAQDAERVELSRAGHDDRERQGTHCQARLQGGAVNLLG